MEFILGLFVVVGLIYLLFRYFGPQILQWLVRRYIQRLDPQAKQQANKHGWHSSSSSRSSSTTKTHRVQTGKLNMKDIAKKKFEKDQGEYIDFEEE